MDSVDFKITGAGHQPLRFVRKTGQSIGEVTDALAQLRITVFRDYPYLYEGSLAYEKTYLQTYLKAERAFLFGVYDGDQLVGATTCIPLIDETPAVQAPFQAAGYDLETVFYFGESILLPAYRGLGLGHRFFNEREAHVNRFGTYTATCFCAVVRPDTHPLRPAYYQPLDTFWMKRGYRQDTRLRSYFDWPDIGETAATPKPMVYWLRALTP